MNIILYSTDCPKCIILERKLKAKGLNFDLVKDVDIMLGKGFMSSPMLEIDGEIMDFAKANKWVNEQGGQN